MKKSERGIMKLVESGFLSVDLEGRIWRHYQWINYIYGYVKLDKPQRAELRNGNYFEIHIRTGGKSIRAKAHRIVWIYLHGSIPNKLQINHKDGVGINNHPDNLELVTTSENQIHAFRTGLSHGRPGEKHHNVRLTDEKVNQIRLEYAAGGVSQKYLGAKYGVGNSQIWKIVNYQRWENGIAESDKIVHSGLRGDNKTGYTGVRLNKGNGKWVASIRYKYQSYHLGEFDDIRDAAKAYQGAKESLYSLDK